MSIKFVFEDNETVPISMLLKKSYNGDNIFFSSGCANILSKAIEIQTENDFIIMYYDVAPNNVKTVKGYENLRMTIKANNIKNMIVVPIICIEYIALRMLDKYDQLLISSKYKDAYNYLVKDLDWGTYVNTCNPNSYILESIEHFYKSVLTQMQTQICKHNSHNYIGNTGQIDWDSGSGKYFYLDCPCERFCKLECKDKVALKAERLYFELPLSIIVNKMHRKYIESLGIGFSDTKLIDVENERKLFYDKLCANMKVNGIKIKFT